ncbi:proteoglycan 4-like isoform X1 [Sebastes umbrosus]|uniref:proteoglycan 4-like isoform X1 n=1 Tax=Sebastes umbrosus TaxID=72105 RepID=UPI0018A0EF3B|nr:proteoglycan 4-like isoform X1 [Sebastes umbrosus]
MRTGRKPRKRKCSVSIQFESTEQKDENCRLRQVSVPVLPLRLTSDQKMSDCVEEEEDRAESLVSGCVSMKSDRSKNDPLTFSNEPGPSESKVQYRPRAESPVPSCLSMESDGSKEDPPDFSNEPGPSETKEKKRSHASVEEPMSRSRTRPGPQTASQTRTRPGPQTASQTRTRPGPQTASQTSTVQNLLHQTYLLCITSFLNLNPKEILIYLYSLFL